jgi:hypothetical protein
MSTTEDAINNATKKLLSAIEKLRTPKFIGILRFMIPSNGSVKVPFSTNPRNPELSVEGYRKLCVLITENITGQPTLFEYDLRMGKFDFNQPQYWSDNSMFEYSAKHRNADGKIHSYDVKGPDVMMEIYNTDVTNKTAKLMLYLIP